MTFNLRFPIQYYDAESGLHYNWHRYYDPETGRYVTADPIGLTGRINQYAYVGGNPVNWFDSEGLQIQLMGDEAQRQYTLTQLKRFVRGCLTIDSKGFLSRDQCGQESECIEGDIDLLINSNNAYRIYPTTAVNTGFGRAHTSPSGGGANIYFDPDVDANYNSGFLRLSTITPSAELAHELLGRATQLELGIPHGRYGSSVRRQSNQRAVDKANPAYLRMGMRPRTSY